MKDPLALNLSPDIRDAIDELQFERVESVVEGSRRRDEELRDLRRQNEGEPTGPEGPWPDSCDLEDPISRELHTTLLAPTRQAIRYPYYLIDPIDPGDDEEARKVEAYFNPRLRQCGFKEAMDAVVYTALESRWAVMVVSYKRIFQKVRRTLYRDVETGYDVEAGDRDPQREYEEVVGLDNGNILYDGLSFRHPAPWNVYTYPVGAASLKVEEPEGAIALIERMYLNAEDLLLGIEEQGFDPEAVKQMLAAGPGSGEADQARADIDERSGVEGADDYYECYQVLGRVPLVVDSDGEIQTPKELLHEDCIWVLCPNTNTVLKRAYSPDVVRPYARVVAYDIPGSLLGHGILSLIRPLQDEMTGTLRLAFDQMNLAAAAPFQVPESHILRFGDVQFGPGKTIPVPTGMTALEQVKVDPNGPQMALQFLQFQYGRAMQQAAVQSVNSNMSGAVRKAAEVNFAEQVMQTKFNLVVANIQRGMEDIAQICLALLLANVGDSDRAYAGPGQGAAEVSQAELDRRFRFLPQVSSDNVNEQARVERDLNLYKVISASPIHQSRIMAGDMTGEYHMMRRLAEHMGERDPEIVLGPPPQAPVMPQLMPPAAADPMMMQQAPQAAQQAVETGTNGTKPRL